MPFVRQYAVGGGGGGGGGVTGSSDSSLTVAGADAIINQAIAPTWTGAHTWQTSDAGTTTVTTLASLSHRNNAAGTPAAAYGVGQLFKLDSSARTLRTAGQVSTVWSTATDGAEVSSIAFSTMLAGTLTEVVRFGTGATLPDSDFSISLGRVLLDTRTTDQAHFSHRDQTGTTSYALAQSAAGTTTLNCVSGQATNISHAGTTRIVVNTTGIGFYGSAAVAKQASGANLTNNVTVGGTTDQIDDFTSLTVYATDAAAIRNNIYQLARKLKQVNDGLRLVGLLT